MKFESRFVYNQMRRKGMDSLQEAPIETILGMLDGDSTEV